MKEFTHPGSGKKELVDLNQLIPSTVTVARNEWKYVAEVKTNLCPDLPELLCNPVEINQVLLNLIINASHAIAEKQESTGDREKGCIEITTVQDDDWIQLTVSDTGMGIPEPIRERIFEPFYTTKAVGQGSGQGLAIAHAVVSQGHGGSISSAPRESGGTTFSIRLPLLTAAKPASDDPIAVKQ
ncbi:MAG: HAMP domain-containing histidine kinase, partial [Pirellulaceae bacterium]|nr:HAMP domain-containing histidine kinase [Pirellulaceae bacterium]